MILTANPLQVWRRPPQKQESDWSWPERIPAWAGAQLPPAEGGSAAPHQQEDPSALQACATGQLPQVRAAAFCTVYWLHLQFIYAPLYFSAAVVQAVSLLSNMGWNWIYRYTYFVYREIYFFNGFTKRICITACASCVFLNLIYISIYNLTQQVITNTMPKDITNVIWITSDLSSVFHLGKGSKSE